VVGRHRALVAVLATAFAVLAFGEPVSNGIEVDSTPKAATALAGDPTATGRTDRTSVTNAGTQTAHGGSSPVISENGRWQVFTSRDDLQPGNPSALADRQNIFVRDLHNDTTTQLSRASTNGTPEPPTADSSSPSISATGRYISFLTTAANIVSANPGSRTLVVCDRDPDTDGVFDEVNGNGSLTNTCVSVYSAATSGAGSIDTFGVPELANDGTRIAWTEQRSASVLDTGAFFADVLNNGVLQPSSQTQVPMLLANPAVNVCGAVSGGAQPTESSPVFTQNASHVILEVNFPNAFSCTGIVDTTLAQGATPASSVRVDAVPDGCGGGFMGDGVAQAGPCAALTGGTEVSVSAPTAADSVFAGGVLFHFHDGPSQINFAALAPNTDTDWMVLATRGFPAYSSEIVSRDSTGSLVNSAAGAISGDGRYVAFEMADPDSSLFAAPAVPGQQVVARDLQTDTNALVTPGVTACSPLSCGSSGGSVSSISLDSTGARVSYDSSATDLVSGDNNAARDAFARTWQPTASNDTTDLGDVQVDTSTQANLNVTVSGFGAVAWDDVIFGGTDAADFSLVASSCRVQDRSSFDPAMHDGESCVIAIRFSPTTAGPKTATISLSSTQFDTPQQVRTLLAVATTTGPVSAPADNTRTSVRNNGGQSPTGGSDSMISGNGRWQVFTSTSNLAGHTPIDPANADNANVFVRDLADPQHTLQISLHMTVANSPSLPSRTAIVAGHPTGASPDDQSSGPSISGDGRFVSFFTNATDIVPIPALQPPDTPDFVLVVCDRDPTDTRDGAGNPILDLPRPGTLVPNYVCFPIQSGALFVDSLGVDAFSSARLAGNGTRIAWIENADNVDQRVRVATLSAPGGTLQAPTDFRYVPSDIAGFASGTNRNNDTDVEQTDATLSEDGNSVVFVAGDGCSFSCPSGAVVETDLAAGTSFRFDAVPGSSDAFLGDTCSASSECTFDPPAMSDDGNRVAFAFRGPSDAARRVYVATRAAGVLSTFIASRSNADAATAGAHPALSGDGRYLAYQSSAPNSHNAVDPPNGNCGIDSADTNVNCQIVARDLVKDLAQVAAGLPRAPSEIVSSSISTNCPNPLPAGRRCASNGFSSNPSIDETGSEIGFDSDSSDIVAGDDNEIDVEGPEPATDSFVHTWRPTLNAAAFAFGTVKLGAHKDKTFTVTESGFGPISLGTTSLTGIGAGDFKLVSTSCTGKTLNDTQTCSVKIRFTPSAPGNREATLATSVGKNGYPRHNPDNTISYDPALIRTLTGFGASAQLEPDPSTLNFGNNLPLAPGKTKTVTINNTGSATLNLTDVVVQDTTHPGAHDDYTVNATDCLGGVPPGGSCVITVTFLGHAVGKRDAALIITDNAPSGPTTIVLLANVPKPKVEINPGVSPPGRVVIVEGTGFAPNLQVDVRLKGSIETATVTTDANGAFDVGLVLFTGTIQGPHFVTAHTHGESPTIAAKGPLLITLGSVDVPELITRH
jgi:hypothetical protein